MTIRNSSGQEVRNVHLRSSGVFGNPATRPATHALAEALLEPIRAAVFALECLAADLPDGITFMLRRDAGAVFTTSTLVGELGACFSVEFGRHCLEQPHSATSIMRGLARFGRLFVTRLGSWISTVEPSAPGANPYKCLHEAMERIQAVKDAQTSGGVTGEGDLRSLTDWALDCWADALGSDQRMRADDLLMLYAQVCAAFQEAVVAFRARRSYLDSVGVPRAQREVRFPEAVIHRLAQYFEVDADVVRAVARGEDPEPPAQPVGKSDGPRRPSPMSVTASTTPRVVVTIPPGMIQAFKAMGLSQDEINELLE
jgi:hypothetical protein